MAELTARNTLGLYVSPDELDGILSGKTKSYKVELNEDSYEQLIETSDGNIILMCDEVPDNDCGCYFYNQGEFPYMLRRWLSFLLLSDGERQVPVKIKYINTKPSKRISFDSEGSGYEDVNGKYCVWNIIYGFTTDLSYKAPNEDFEDVEDEL